MSCVADGFGISKNHTNHRKIALILKEGEIFSDFGNGDTLGKGSVSTKEFPDFLLSSLKSTIKEI